MIVAFSLIPVAWEWFKHRRKASRPGTSRPTDAGVGSGSDVEV